MRFSWIFLVLTGAAYAQAPTLPLDLANGWRLETTDDPRFADPALDDSAWKAIRFPLPPMPPGENAFGVTQGWIWLRKSVDVPRSAERRDLALTLGSFAEVYEVQAGGIRVGQVGGPRLSATYVARPRTFSIPATTVKAGRLVLALRVWSSGFVGPPNLAVSGVPDRGPYLLTDSASAPADAAEHSMRERQQAKNIDFALSLMLLMLALLLVSGWVMAGKQSASLIWFAGFLISEALNNFWITLVVAADLPQSTTQFAGNLLGLSAYLLAQWALTEIGVRSNWRLHLLTLFPLLTQVLYNVSGQPFDFVWTFGAISLLQSGLAWMSGREAWAARRELRRPLAWRLAGVTVFLLLQTQNVPSPWLFLAPVSTPLGYLSPYSVAIVLASGILTAILILGLGATHQRLASELEGARAVQQLLLPRSLPREVEAIYLPAAEVGGDFFFTESTCDGLLIVAGDVFGKGLKAAMYVSVLLGALRARRSNRPAETLADLNRVAALVLEGGGFLTAVAAWVEVDRVTIANAGNPAPYAGGTELALDPGLPLGVVAEVEYEEREFTRPDLLTFVSDGVIEAENANRELFGFDRTRDISMKTAQDIASAAKAWGQNDDITVVTVRRNA